MCGLLVMYLVACKTGCSKSGMAFRDERTDA